ncbi:hypothetical protein [Jiangella alkaliphila]|uniref:hypothetical protein n=1 Tax=Jiangella alkaliphila TaxID=419479 RepID=UPI00128CCB9D|nr:hypothetical protein [Jiangella alkaliphila]
MRTRPRLHTRHCNRCAARLNGTGMPLHGAGTLCPACWVTTRTERFEARARAAVAATLADEQGGW